MDPMRWCIVLYGAALPGAIVLGWYDVQAQLTYETLDVIRAQVLSCALAGAGVAVYGSVRNVQELGKLLRGRRRHE